MEDRIQINGVWYAKEEELIAELHIESHLETGVKYDGMVFESDLYAFDCTRIYDDNGCLYKDGNVSIKFTDKSVIHDIEKFQEHWSNEAWMQGVIEDDVEAIEAAMESLCSQGLVELKEVLTTLRADAWIN